MPIPTPDSYVFTPGVTLYAGMATPSGGTTLTTITLANTSATEQSAGFVSPMFGLPLKQGDVPAGQYPAFFLADDTPVPATIHSVTSWPDGSMKWCGVFLRVPTTVAGSGTLAITVKNGGSAPGSSARAVSDLTAADLKVELTGVTNLTGTWTATLNDAITNGTVVVIGDGPAGMLVRILGDFKQSGSAHGQLVCWHYALIAQNTSGGLLGIRYLGRVAQPWADVSTPTPTRRVVNAVLKAGASTLRTLQGHDTTETPGANIGMPHYSSFFTAGADAKWDFVQGGGSASADCTVRVIHDKTYVVKSRLVPPYDLTVSPTSFPSVDYAPFCQGSLEWRNINSTGPSNFIGIIPEWATVHLMTQAAVDERAVRVSALACGGFRTAIRRSTTKQIIPCVDLVASYTGLGTVQTAWRYSGGTNTGLQTPTDTTSLWSGEVDPSHRPSAHYYAYLITGEPQYADMQEEYAAEIILYTDPGNYTRNVGSSITQLRSGSYTGQRNTVISGTTYKGAGLMFLEGGVRQHAWALRDLAQAIAILPDTPAHGADVKGYLSDVLESNLSAANALNAAMPTSWQDAGLWSTQSDTATSSSTDTLYESPWMQMYLSSALCHISQITDTAGSATFRQHLGKFISSVNAQMDIACLSAYRWRQWKGDGTLVTSIGEVLFLCDATLTFNTTTERFTVSGTRGSWSPTAGDKFAFSTNLDADKPFAAASNNTTLYAVNPAGQTAQLAVTSGGSAIDVTTAASITSSMVQLQNASPLLNFVDGDYYVRLIYEAARFHEACGDSFISSARVKQDGNVSALGVSFTSDPRSAVSFQYPG